MTDDEFFAFLLDALQATTGPGFWEPHRFGGTDEWGVSVVGEGGREVVAVGFTEADANFVCAVHAALPDMVSRLRQAQDAAVKADERCDAAQHLIVELSRKQDG